MGRQGRDTGRNGRYSHRHGTVDASQKNEKAKTVVLRRGLDNWATRSNWKEKNESIRRHNPMSEIGTGPSLDREETVTSNCTLNLTRLENLLKKDPNEVLLRLLSPNVGFMERLEHGSTSNRMTELLLKAIAKVCNSIHSKSLFGLLEMTHRSKLLKYDVLDILKKHISLLNQVSNDTISDIIIILRALVRSFPSKSLKTVSMIFSQVGCILQSYVDLKEAQLSDNYKLLDEEIMSTRMQMHSGILQRDQENVESITVDVGNDFRRMSVIPTCEEIKGNGDPFLRENKIYQKYDGAIDYLDIHFRLLKEDLIRPLRGGLSELLRSREEGVGKKLRNVVKVYTQVRIISMRCSQNGLIYKVKFDISRLRGIRWSAGKRLMLGSLVCLSADQFKTMLIATIADRNVRDLTQGIIYLCFDSDSEQNLRIKFNYAYEMVESPAYYEPYKHVLKALQYMDEKPLPFEDYLLNQAGEEAREAQPPKYLRDRNIKYDFSSLISKRQDRRDVFVPTKTFLSQRTVPICDLAAWPSAKELDLDDFQYTALRTAVTKEFAVIQGPPGTGKTFIGVKIVQLLLHNRSQGWFGCRQLWNGPLMIICYTNHALDQFLEEIIELYPFDVREGKLIRIGSRSKSENERLKQCLLTSVRQNTNVRRSKFFGATKKPKERMEALESKILILTSYIELAEEEIIDPKELMPFMAYDYFQNQPLYRFIHWLNDKSAMEGLPNIFQLASSEDHAFDPGELDLEEMQDDRERGYNHFKAEKKIANKIKQDLFLWGNTFLNFRAVGNSHLFYEWQSIRSIHHHLHQTFSEKEYLEIEDIWQLNLVDRWRLYNYWTSLYIGTKTEEMQKMLKEHAMERAKIDEVRNEEDYSIFSNAKIIAMTTTGSAKYRNILQRVKPKIVIVEEAAEVLEAHIVASLSDECEHLILIGDHQQLRPKTEDYHLAKDYHLDVSLFEKLVLNKLHCDYLTTQHRMRPEIAQLLVPHIYKSLENHESVLNYKNVEGILGNLFFISHSKEEDEADDNKSHSNQHEASFMAAFCNYLLNVGYKPSQITVLTTYISQFFLLRKLLSESGVRITPVDNYQGEENDIILLSLVRSNKNNKIGFLNVSNRVCVALSRSRKGLFIIGNGELLREVSPLWRNILNALEKEKKFVDSLPLGCRRHRNSENVVYVSDAGDFQKVPRHGCRYPCDNRLPCGHVCDKMCHPFDQEHKENKCKKPCSNICPNDHPCRKKCFEYCGETVNLIMRFNDDINRSNECCNKVGAGSFLCNKECKEFCGNCVEPVNRILSDCLHEATMPCYMTEVEFLIRERCHEPVKRILSRCQHEATMPCYMTEEEFLSGELCKVEVEKTISRCGHTVKLPCHYPIDSYKCRESCNESCPVGHPCKNACHDVCGKCDVIVEKLLPKCQHIAKLPCHQALETYNCRSKCNNNCPAGHPCLKLCYDKCGTCKVKVKKTLPECEHVADIPCWLSPSEYRCKLPCEKSCPTGHLCKKTCGKECGNCTVQIQQILPICKHTKLVECYKIEEDIICLSPCEKLLPCGHKCEEICGALQCTNQCEILVEKALSCGHVTKLMCFENPANHLCCFKVDVIACVYGHIEKVDCYKRNENIANCTKLVELECSTKLLNHVLKFPCHERNQRKDIVRNGCPNVCHVILECGHACSEVCSVCVFTGKHSVCKKACNKPHPLCSHSCTGLCSDEKCSSCEVQSLQLICHDHGTKINQVCCKPYEPCLKMCKWRCPHKECKKVCSQPCERSPCNSECPRPHPSRCGHRCAGLCGETCPRKCPHCDKDVITKIEEFLKIRITSEMKILELNPCGDVVEVGYMDRWVENCIKSPPCEVSFFRSLKCPVCFKKVNHCPRYNRHIKRCELNINNAKIKLEESITVRQEVDCFITSWLRSKCNEFNMNNERSLIQDGKEGRLRIGSICILHLIERLLEAIERPDELVKLYDKSMNVIGQRMMDGVEMQLSSDIIHLYIIYLQVQIHRMKKYIRGPSLAILDNCQKEFEPLTPFVSENCDLKRTWKVIERVSRQLSKKVTSKERKDSIENYMDYLHRFYEVEKTASYTSQWLCCSEGHIYSREVRIDDSQINAHCSLCHLLHTVGALQPLSAQDLVQTEVESRPHISNLCKPISKTTKKADKIRDVDQKQNNTSKCPAISVQEREMVTTLNIDQNRYTIETSTPGPTDSASSTAMVKSVINVKNSNTKRRKTNLIWVNEPTSDSRKRRREDEDNSEARREVVEETPPFPKWRRRDGSERTLAASRWDEHESFLETEESQSRMQTSRRHESRSVTSLVRNQYDDPTMRRNSTIGLRNMGRSPDRDYDILYTRNDQCKSDRFRLEGGRESVHNRIGYRMPNHEENRRVRLEGGRESVNSEYDILYTRNDYRMPNYEETRCIRLDDGRESVHSEIDYIMANHEENRRIRLDDRRESVHVRMDQRIGRQEIRSVHWRNCEESPHARIGQRRSSRQEVDFGMAEEISLLRQHNTSSTIRETVEQLSTVITDILSTQGQTYNSHEIRPIRGRHFWR